MDYFEMWENDKKSVLATMHKNMAADIDAGYNPAGACIARQMADIDAFAEQFNAEFGHLQKIILAYADGPRRVNRWCYMDMKRRGAIE